MAICASRTTHGSKVAYLLLARRVLNAGVVLAPLIRLPPYVIFDYNSYIRSIRYRTHGLVETFLYGALQLGTLRFWNGIGRFVFSKGLDWPGRSKVLEGQNSRERAGVGRVTTTSDVDAGTGRESTADAGMSIEDVLSAVSNLQAQAAVLSGPDASTQLVSVTALAAKVDALRVSLVATIQTSEVWRATDPNGTPASFLRREHLLDHHQARADLRAAESYARFPELAQACRDGRIGRDKVDVILGIGLRNPQRSEALPDFLHIFIGLAQSAPVSVLKRTMGLWADQIDPVTTARDDDDAHRRRRLHIHELGDGVKIDGFFGREQGMRLMAAINGALDRHRSEQDEAGQPGDTDGHGPGHAVSTAMQRADAFMESIIRPVFEAHLLPTAGGAPANICVTVPLTRLQDPQAPVDPVDVANRLASDTLRHHSASLRATNGPGHVLISASLAQKLSCDATVQRVVLSPMGKPLDIGRRTRVIPEQIRTALVIRDGGCVFPFCDKPPGWSEGHHIQHWSAGGSTSLDNLALLCSRHHHQIHAHSIPIEFDSDGKPWVNLEHRWRG